MAKYFGNMVLQEKAVGDWRAFVCCRDSKGQWWELRASETNPARTAHLAYERYLEDETKWNLFGYPTGAPKDEKANESRTSH